MNLLIVTQKVDKSDQVLGFFHNWLLEFSKNLDKLTVICLEKGEYDLPENVRVLSLGKEEHNSKINYLKRLYSYIWTERKNYTHVFVHMNPIYMVLCGLCWKIMRKKISQWYVHKHVDLKLRIAEMFVNDIFTVSKESFRLQSKKVNIVGHGIDTDYFVPLKNNLHNNNILSVSRISETKNIHLMIEVLHKLSSEFILKIVGGAITEKDKVYEKRVRSLVDSYGLRDRVEFVGNVPNHELVGYYQNSSVFINLSNTGSVDKAVLEALSCELAVVTSNEAFKNFPVYFSDDNAENISTNILNAISVRNTEGRELIQKEHSLQKLIPKIVNMLEK